MAFIKLTLYSGKKIRLNTNAIESYCEITKDTFKGAKDCKGMTSVVPLGIQDDSNVYVIQETPEQIDALIASAEGIFAEAQIGERVCKMKGVEIR